MIVQLGGQGIRSCHSSDFLNLLKYLLVHENFKNRFFQYLGRLVLLSLSIRVH
jgi:hypothetical protein